MLKIRDDVDLNEKLYKEYNYKWDGFNECYSKEDANEHENLEITVYICDRSITITYYTVYDEGTEYSEEDATIEDLKEYAPELLNLI